MSIYWSSLIVKDATTDADLATWSLA